MTNQEAAVQPAAPADNSLERFDTTATIRDVMNTLIDPHSDALWNAVSYVVTEDGVEESYPQTDEDWLALRYNAVAVIEGANSLMIPGREVAPPGATTDFPEYEYLPEEVAQRLEEDSESWVAYAQSFQQIALQMLDAVEDRSIINLTEIGGVLDQACEGCHSQYWYRSFPDQ